MIGRLVHMAAGVALGLAVLAIFVLAVSSILLIGAILVRP